MSQNPAHAHRRVLAPPAVTRFQLRTASASEAVFAAPFVAPVRTRSGYSPRRAETPVSYEPLPAATTVRPRPHVNTPVFSRAPERTRRTATARTDAESNAAGTPQQPLIRPLPGALPPPTRPLELTAGTTREPLRTWHLPGPSAAPSEQSTPRTASWEIATLTTPDYKAPRSIHDPPHDAWPVAAPAGSAIPPWGDGMSAEPPEESRAAHVPQTGQNGIIEQDVPYVDTDGPVAGFPLDAFIVPGGAAQLSERYSQEISEAVADRLEALAAQIRTHGVESLGAGRDTDELARLVAALVTGFVSRRA